MMLLAFMAAACVAVSGPNITARDLAQAVPAFTPADPNAAVAYTPAPGVQRIFQGIELRQALKRLGYDTDQPLENACFARPVAPVTQSAVVEAMKRSLGAEAKIDVVEMSRFPAPAGEINFPLDQIGAPPVALWRGYVTYDGNKQFPIWARVKIAVHLLEAIATEDLKAGSPIKPSQVVFQNVEGFPQAHSTPQTAANVTGYVPRHFIAAHSPIWRDALTPPNDVEKGDRVTVLVHSGQAELSFDAEAETSGRRGDLIAFKNPESGRLFRARIEGPGKAGLMTVAVNR